MKKILKMLMLSTFLVGLNSLAFYVEKAYSGEDALISGSGENNFLSAESGNNLDDGSRAPVEDDPRVEGDVNAGDIPTGGTSGNTSGSDGEEVLTSNLATTYESNQGNSGSQTSQSTNGLEDGIERPLDNAQQPTNYVSSPNNPHTLTTNHTEDLTELSVGGEGRDATNYSLQANELSGTAGLINAEGQLINSNTQDP